MEKVYDMPAGTVTACTAYGTLTLFRNDWVFAFYAQAGLIFEHDIFEVYLKQRAKSWTAAIDVGAHVGSYTLMLGNTNPALRIFAFEPQEPIYRLLVQNILENGLIHVTHTRAAIGHRNISEVHLSCSITDGPSAGEDISYGGNTILNLGGMQLGDDGELVAMLTLDGFEFPHIDFVKIDVEGAESLVLLGARRLIERDSPLIQFEHNHKILPEHVLRSINAPWPLPAPEELLQDWGYRIIQVSTDNFIGERRNET